jgi:hypothetical protein
MTQLTQSLPEGLEFFLEPGQETSDDRFNATSETKDVLLAAEGEERTKFQLALRRDKPGKNAKPPLFSKE